jgi:hypothetical protein
VAITVLGRDRDLAVTGVIDTWTVLDVTLRFNAVGSWSLTVPATDDAASVLQPGGGVIIVRDGEVLLSGPLEHTAFAWSAEGDDDAGPGTLTLSGGDDLARLGGRLVYPDPARDATDQRQSHFTRRQAAELLMRDLLRLNAGPDAVRRPHDRRIPRLMLAPEIGASPRAVLRAQFTPLLDALRRVAAAGGLGFRLHASDAAAGIEFEIYQPRDLTGTARFSRSVGNLREVSFTREMPTVNVALVAGTRDDTSNNTGSSGGRVIREYRDDASHATWGVWLETWVDQRGTSDTDALDDAGAQALREGAETVELAATVLDTPTLRYGPDDPAHGIQGYGLGDLVTIEPLPGEQVAQIVREVRLQATPEGGETVTPLVGTEQATTDPTWVSAVARLDRRLASAERD